MKNSTRKTRGGRAAVADRQPIHRAIQVDVNWPSPNAADSLTRKLGIDASGIAARRQYIRLDEHDRVLLADLAAWAQEVAP